ncbi:MAG: hypothetical protein II038_08840 [Lachnospiraceae bacterium]|nr:hypothetical protein [Lachnospiraceae bacterium]
MIGFKKIIERWDWLLIIGAILSPMTGLRIAKVGPAEFLCFIWALRYIHIKKQELNLISKFSILFLISLLIGTMICLVVAPDEFVANGWATWVYLLFIGNTLFTFLRKKKL